MVIDSLGDAIGAPRRIQVDHRAILVQESMVLPAVGSGVTDDLPQVVDLGGNAVGPAVAAESAQIGDDAAGIEECVVAAGIGCGVADDVTQVVYALSDAGRPTGAAQNA